MAERCPLSAPLMLKDTQGGVVGETGTVWTIAPDCSFTIARQIGNKVLEPHNRGHLTLDQEAHLKGMLDRSAQLDFTNQRGDPPQVNPRRISFSYGGKQAVLTLPSGGGAIGESRTLSVDERAKWILELATTMKSILGS